MTLLRKLSPLAVCLILFLKAVAVKADCPNCYNNVEKLDGRGQVSATDHRQQINLRIDNTWDISGEPGHTSANIWDGITGAASAWNSQAGSYFFNLNQTDNSVTDIRITRRALPAYECARSEMREIGATNERVIILPPDAANWSADAINCRVKHEMGHEQGLADSYNAAACSSVMNQSVNCSQCASDDAAGTITASDVARVNQFASVPSIGPNPCTVHAEHISNQGGGGGGGGGGSPCTTGVDTDVVPRDGEGCYDVFKTPWIDCGNGPVYGETYYDGSNCNFLE